MRIRPIYEKWLKMDLFKASIDLETEDWGQQE